MNIDEISSIVRNTSIKSDLADFITHNKKIHRRRHSLGVSSTTRGLNTPPTPRKSKQTKSRLPKTCDRRATIKKQLFCSTNSHIQTSKKPQSHSYPSLHPPLHSRIASNYITYHNLNIIGRGSFSTVYKVVDIATNTIYALKQGRKRVTLYNAHTMVSECNILSKLKYHPHIVQFQCFWIEPNTHVLNQLFKYYQHGTLADLIQSNHRFSESQIFIVLLQITRGLAHIHELNIIHFDIKPENICVDSDYSLKIADFGISVDITNTKHLHGDIAQSGDARYISPEIMYEEYKNMDIGYLKNCDVFALGCIVMELLLDSMLPNGGEIFHYLRGIQATKNINWNYLNEHVDQTDGEPWDECDYFSVFIRDVVLKMMYKDPKHRISSNALLGVLCNAFDSQTIENKMNAFKTLILPSVSCSKRSDLKQNARFLVRTVDINNYGCINRMM